MQDFGEVVLKAKRSKSSDSKKAVRIIDNMNYRVVWGSFQTAGIADFACLYIIEVSVYCKFRCALIPGSDVHQYETRDRDNFRPHQHRLTLSQHLPLKLVLD
ncbi:hypothetical protein J6590_020036 [Homalodisca vitripennis]|nr:hypothetical protein J6590_020036 [Homalodisca vitripennis]